MGAHDTGPLIRSKDGFYLAIPTEAAGRGLRGRRITPGEWERRRGLRLRFVYRRTGPSLLVADGARINKRGQAVASRSKTGRNQVTAPIFLLVPQVIRHFGLMISMHRLPKFRRRVPWLSRSESILTQRRGSLSSRTQTSYRLNFTSCVSL